MRYIALLISSFALVVVSSAANADSQNLSAEMKVLAAPTSWTNQSGSVASISFDPASQPGTWAITGTYVNNAAGYGCRGTPYPITGIYYANTQTISFSVAWSNASADCQTVTGWTGYIDIRQSPFQMQTNWNLAYMGAAGHQIAQGRDTFTMNNQMVSERLITDN